MVRILVIEDDPAQRYLVDVVLRRVGYETVGVGSGDEALQLLETDSAFDAVLSDFSMPGMKGDDLLVALGARYPSLPVIVMTVHAGSAWVDVAASHGAAATLPKPFFGQELVDKIKSVLRPQTEAL